MNAIDGFIVICLGFAFYRGWRRGLLAALLGIGAYGLGLFLAATGYKSLASWLDGQLTAVARIQEWLGAELALPATASRIKVDVVPSLNLERVLADLSLPPFYREEMLQQLSQLTVPVPAGVETLAQLVTNYVANSLWNALIFVLLFLLVSGGAKQVARVWMYRRGNGLLGTVDRLCGGVLTTGVATVVLVLVLSWFYAGPADSSPLRQETQPLVETSQLLPYLRDGNKWLTEYFAGYTFR
ncbi:MAG: CvpA family protein [Heliobacteriaceae bacterium]|nr:CvpA family protein [Heliobacteriaceae bacterium]